MNTIEKTKEVEVNKTKAIKAYLKARVKELAKTQKTAKVGNKDIQRQVTKTGWNSELCRKLQPDKSWEITITHILYNRLRNRPPHTGSVESDEAYMKEYGDFTGIVWELEEKFKIKLDL
jgi:hypothetical protein